MAIFNLMKYLLFLTIFNAFFSLTTDKKEKEINLGESNKQMQIIFIKNDEQNEDFDELTKEIEIIDLMNPKSIQFDIEKDKPVYITIFPYYGKTENIESFNDDGISMNLTNSVLQFSINTTKITSNICKISIHITNETNITIYHVTNNNYNPIKDDNKEITIKNTPIIRFLSNEEKKIRCKLNSLKENSKEKEIVYGIIEVPTNNPLYIPSPMSFYSCLNNIMKIEKLEQNKDEFEIDLENNHTNGNNKNKFFAFILSLKGKDEFKVTINEDRTMNYFLFGSMGLALVLGVISFFLIRRKPTTNQDDFYEEKQEEEEDN